MTREILLVNKLALRALFSGLLTITAIHASFAAEANKGASNQIDLNAPEWLGTYKLEKPRLTAIKTAVENALSAPIDAEQQCGDETGLCVVRTTREWVVNSDRFREVVINLHMIGHATRAVKQVSGQWPSVSIE